STFFANLTGYAVKSGHLSVIALGSENTNDMTLAASATDVAPQARLSLDGICRGDGTGSQVRMLYQGHKKGGLDLYESGGQFMRMDTRLLSSSRLINDNLRIDGGPVSDYLQMYLYDLAQAGFGGRIDGHEGVNTAVHTSNVTAINCTYNIGPNL